MRLMFAVVTALIGSLGGPIDVWSQETPAPAPYGPWQMMDGWGMGWFEKGRPAVSKSPRPIYRDRRGARKAAEQAKTVPEVKF